MNGRLERERKLEAPPEFSLARADGVSDAYTLAPAERHRLHTTYYDTPDLRLIRWGASLRFRAGEGWTLKLPQPSSGTGTYRVEHVFPGDAHVVPQGSLDLAAAILRGKSVQPVVELRTIRTQRTVSAGGDDVAEIVEDDVRVVQSTAVVERFRQLEIELQHEAPETVLDDLSRSLRRAGAGRPDSQPKVVIAVGDRASTPEVAVPEIGAGASAADVVRAALADSVIRLVRVDPQLRVAPGADAVHDARVAVRRLRAHVRTFEPLLDPAWAREVCEQLRWLSDVLSSARDGDVLLAEVTKQTTALPATEDRRRLDAVLAPLRKRRADAYEELARVLRTPRYIALIDAVIDAAKAPRVKPCARRKARKLIAALVRPVWRRLRKRVRRAGRSPGDRELHRIRIKAKYVRYAAESLEPVVGKRAKRLAVCVEALQTCLGMQHDAVNAARVVREELQTSDAAFVAGQIAAAEQQAATEYRDAWRASWRRVVRAKRRWLGD